MAGRYTAYHVYQDLSFTEADRAAAPPFTLPEYHCAHSQRGYLFQFDNMAQRNHFDAATTTCCDEPVLNFQNKPQFASRSAPMKPRDCAPKVGVGGCQQVEVSIEDNVGMCASQSARVRRIKIKCPSACLEFSEILGGGIFKGQFGTFRALGMEADELLILDYNPDPQVIEDIYKRCSGIKTFTEQFCNARSLSFEVRGGLDFPGDCGCDCSGDLGIFPAPEMRLAAPGSIDGGPENQASPGVTIMGDPACRGAGINGVFHGIFGETSVSWAEPTIYSSDGSSRKVSRNQPVVGASDNPACCGGFVEWTASDGCGGSRTETTSVNAHVADMSIAPLDGTTLYEGDGHTFTGMGACSYSDSAGLDIETVCLANGVSELYRFDSMLVRNIDSTLAFEASHACSGCCGGGMIYLSFNNGCGSVMTAAYPVRRALAPTASQETIGRAFRCERFFRDLAPIGYFFRVAVADLRCDGSFGVFTNPLPGYYESVEECLARITGPAAPEITGPAGAMAVMDAATCLFYSDNGEAAGLEFMSRIVSVKGERCCVIDTTNGSWINGGPGNGCCPN